MRRRPLLPPLLAVAASAAVGGALAGCGGSNKTSAPSPTTSQTRATTTAASTSTAGPGALQAEANSAATGDIPDNQVFLMFRNPRGGWSMKYPEGWAQSGSGSRIAFRDKNNIVRVVVVGGASPTPASIRQDLASVTRAHVQSGPARIALAGTKAFKVVYRTVSAPNQVTGKRVTLLVDRYYLPHGNKEAIVDLGTPQGVDNVDAYRLMIESFRWR